jgi:hypothetical protein
MIIAHESKITRVACGDMANKAASAAKLFVADLAVIDNSECLIIQDGSYHLHLDFLIEMRTMSF